MGCGDGNRRRKGGRYTGRTEPSSFTNTTDERTEERGEGGSEWRSREGGLKASSLHFGSEHRRTNDVLIILGGGGAVFRAEQKLRTVKSDVQ